MTTEKKLNETIEKLNEAVMLLKMVQGYLDIRVQHYYKTGDGTFGEIVLWRQINKFFNGGNNEQIRNTTKTDEEG